MGLLSLVSCFSGAVLGFCFSLVWRVLRCVTFYLLCWNTHFWGGAHTQIRFLHQWHRRYRGNIGAWAAQVCRGLREVSWLHRRPISHSTVWTTLTSVAVRAGSLKQMAVWHHICLRENLPGFCLVLLLVGGERRRRCAGLVRRERQWSGESGLQQVGGRQPLSVVSQRRTGGVIGGFRGVGPDCPVLHLSLSLQQRLERKERHRRQMRKRRLHLHKGQVLCICWLIVIYSQFH